MDDNFTLETDASQFALGAFLLQNNRPVAYISRSLNKAEQNYSITEREVLAALWAMEKLEYYLIGKNFTLITDHKAIEFIKKKIDFGSSRTRRWFERLQRFEFDVKYRKGEELVRPDALNRACEYVEKGEETMKDNPREDKILMIHKQFNHRKVILRELKEQGIDIKSQELNRILNKCEICARKDVGINKGGEFIRTTIPGEIFAIDLLEIAKKKRIIIGIDYFSRKIYGKLTTMKDAKSILEFIKETYEAFPFETLLTDNGKEFENKELKTWVDSKNITHRYTIPYHHKSNGRVERANRTIRNAIKKTRGILKHELPRIIEAYNETYHRGVGMSPNKAVKKENYDVVRSNSLKYEKEFKILKGKRFEIGSQVLVKNEKIKGKMDDVFTRKGIILRKLSENTYEIEDESGKTIRRHTSQLRSFDKGDVGLTAAVNPKGEINCRKAIDIIGLKKRFNVRN